MHSNALFTVAQIQRPPGCPAIDEEDVVLIYNRMLAIKTWNLTIHELGRNPDEISETKTNTVWFHFHVESNKTKQNITQNRAETDFGDKEQADSCQGGGGWKGGKEQE